MKDVELPNGGAFFVDKSRLLGGDGMKHQVQCKDQHQDALVNADFEEAVLRLLFVGEKTQVPVVLQVDHRADRNEGEESVSKQSCDGFEAKPNFVLSLQEVDASAGDAQLNETRKIDDLKGFRKLSEEKRLKNS